MITTAIAARVVLALAGANLILPRFAGGQDVTGLVRDARTRAPLPGAVVMLLGADRQSVTRTLTSRSGPFRLRREPAELLRVIRIGYAPQEVPIAEIGDRELTIDLVPLGSRLPPVTVSRSPVCPRRADQHEALALWTAVTEAPSALVVASEAVSTSPHSRTRSTRAPGARAVRGTYRGPQPGTTTDTVVQLLYSRQLDRDGQRVVRQSWRREDLDRRAGLACRRE